MKKIEFMASLPPIQSAILLDGKGDGARIKLDIPASEGDKYMEIQKELAGKSFRVTIEYEKQGGSDW